MPHNDPTDVNDGSLVDDSTLRKKRALFALGICPDDDEEDSSESNNSVEEEEASSIGHDDEPLPPPPLALQSNGLAADDGTPPKIIRAEPPKRIILNSQVSCTEQPTVASSAPQVIRSAMKPQLPKPSLIPLVAKRRCVESEGARANIKPSRGTDVKGGAERLDVKGGAERLSSQSHSTLAYLDFLKSIDEISKRNASS